METLVTHGSEVKVLKKAGDLVTLTGHLVVFDNPASPVKDLAGDYFTSDTYFGARKGDGADCLFHHGIPVANLKFAGNLAGYLYQPLKVALDEAGLVAEVVLDMRKEYEAFTVELAEQKALGWSSGSASHMIKREADGWLKRWPIIEGSLTPTPCEPRTSAVPLKSLRAGALKSTNLTARVDAVYTAFYRFADAAYDYSSYVCEVWDEYAIVWVKALLGGGFYKAPYSYDGQTVTFATTAEWSKVEHVSGWEAMKSLYEIRKAQLGVADEGGILKTLSELNAAAALAAMNLSLTHGR